MLHTQSHPVRGLSLCRLLRRSSRVQDPFGPKHRAVSKLRNALPVHVAENGYGAIEQAVPGHALQDSYRIRYMTRYLEALQEAIDEGADVRSYFAWTLLDNFEWAFGYDYRFGLVHVDRTSGQRTPKASADWYRQVIAANSTPRL